MIQQGIIQNDLDLKALTRHTGKGKASDFKVTFDPVSPPVFLPAKTYSPINSQNTLFLFDAFWALLLPTTTTFRVCDIWRGYWAQRLLWEIGGFVEFSGANALRVRNAYSAPWDELERIKMSNQTARLIAFLSSWSCPKRLTFFDCVSQLSFDMANEGLWDRKDAENTAIWLMDLRGVGYLEPRRVLSTLHPCWRRKWKAQLNRLNPFSDCKESFVNVIDNHKKTSVLQFFPVDQYIASNISHEKGISSTRSLNQVASICPDMHLNRSTILEQPFKQDYFFRDVLLIIVFNYPHYENLRYMEAIYRSKFANIVYCGTDVHAFRKVSKDFGLRNLSFIEADVDKGWLGYICVIKAIEAGFNVTGYLINGDDVLLNVWTFSGFNKTRMWTTMKEAGSVELDWDLTTPWPWWTHPKIRRTWHRASSELNNTHVPTGIKSVDACKQTLQSNIQKLGIKTKQGLVFHCMADIYYIPARWAVDVKWYLTFYLERRVFLEIAVPMVLFGLEGRDEMELIDGKYLWVHYRKTTWKFFNPLLHYLHPVKLTQKINQDKFCSQYVPLLIKHVTGFNESRHRPKRNTPQALVNQVTGLNETRQKL